MKNVEIIFAPASLTISSCVKLVDYINGLERANQFIFDFAKTTHVQPFTLLYLSSEIARFSMKHRDSEVSIANHEHMTYAGHMGFFKAFNVDYGKYPGEASGSDNYLPIKLYDCDDIREKAADSYIREGELVEQIASEIATVLCQSYTGELIDTLTYALREIIRNIIEHSESNQFGICAQHWPSKKTVQAAILDRGIGVRKGLSSNPHLTLDNDEAAINLALLPGVSGKAYKGKRSNPHDVWANSGYGLYMTNRLCRNGGNFFISSGNAGLLLRGDHKASFPFPFQGTALRLVLRTDSVSNLSLTLDKYREEGAKIAKDYIDGKLVSASTASRMLSRDFND